MRIRSRELLVVWLFGDSLSLLSGFVKEGTRNEMMPLKAAQRENGMCGFTSPSA